MDAWIDDTLAAVRQGRPGELSGSQGSLDLLVSGTLIDRAIAAHLPPDGAVKDVSVRPLSGRARVTIHLARPSFLPPLTVGVTVDRQPDLPAAPELVLKLELPPGLGLLLGVGANLFATLPPGLRVEGDRLHVDLAALLARQHVLWALRYARSLVVSFEEGRVRIQGSAALE